MFYRMFPSWYLKNEYGNHRPKKARSLHIFQTTAHDYCLNVWTKTPHQPSFVYIERPSWSSIAHSWVNRHRQFIDLFERSRCLANTPDKDQHGLGLEAQRRPPGRACGPKCPAQEPRHPQAPRNQGNGGIKKSRNSS